MSATEIDLTWRGTSSTVTGFIVQRSTDGVNFSNLASVGPAVTSYSDIGLNEGTNYTYRVLAANMGGRSQASQAVSLDTLKPLPSALDVSAVTSGSPAWPSRGTIRPVRC